MTSTYIVEGMTCQHCVSSITEAVGEVPGVTGVVVDLPTGRTDVTGLPQTDLVRQAVQDAGFKVA